MKKFMILATSAKVQAEFGLKIKKRGLSEKRWNPKGREVTRAKILVIFTLLFSASFIGILWWLVVR